MKEGLSTFRAGTLQVETHGKSMGQGQRPEATGGCCRRAGTATPSTSSPDVEDLFASPPTSASAACLCVNRRPEGGASYRMGTRFLSLCPGSPPLYTPSILNKLWFSGAKMHSVSTAETHVLPRRAEPKDPQSGEVRTPRERSGEYSLYKNPLA